jgi:hypothetical protein
MLRVPASLARGAGKMTRGEESMAKRFGVDLKISRLMLLIGLMCERLQRFEESEQILGAMKAYRDDLPHPATFLGLCYISQGRVREALEELEAVRTAYPEFEMSKVLLGIAHRDAGRPGWQPLLREVIENGRDEFAVGLAQDTLGLEAGGVDAGGTSDTVESIPRELRVYA